MENVMIQRSLRLRGCVVLVAASCLLVSGCNPLLDLQAGIVGKWKGIPKNGEAVTTPATELGVIEFRADGTVTSEDVPSFMYGKSRYRVVDPATIEIVTQFRGDETKLTMYEATIVANRLTVWIKDEGVVEFERVR